MSKNYSLFVPDVTCECKKKEIETTLAAIAGVNSAKILNQKLLIAIKDTHKESEIRKDILQSLDKLTINYSTMPQKKWSHNHWIQAAFGISLGVLFLALPIFLPAIPMAATITIAIISTCTTIYLGASSYKKAFLQLINPPNNDTTQSRLKRFVKRFGMDSLFTLSSIAILSASIASFFIPALPMMFEAGLLIFGFQHLGIAIRNQMGASSGAYQSLSANIGGKIKIANTNSYKSLDNITPKDLIEITPGEIIPVDGICKTSGCSINTEIVSGQSGCYVSRENEHLKSGMTLSKRSQPMVLEVTKPFNESYIKKFDDTVHNALKKPSIIEKQADAILQYFVPTVIAISIILGVSLSFFFPVAIALKCATTVLVSVCPCTLGMIVPLAQHVGVEKALMNEVIIKSTEKFENAGKVNKLVTDLYGTLTMGAPKVHRVSPSSNVDKNNMLKIMGAIEKDSEHAFAKAIYEHTKNNVNESEEIKEFQLFNNGVQATIEGVKYYVGNKQMLEDNAPHIEVPDENELEAGESTVYLASSKELLGSVIIRDELRNDAIPTINAIKAMGIDVYMCTGTDKYTAHRFAKKLGISDSHTLSECISINDDSSKKNKKDIIANFIKEGACVAMIGDGKNDLPAMTTSNFGIAIVHDNNVGNVDSADAEVHGNSLRPLASLLDISRQTSSNIKQNLSASLAYNVTVLLAAGGASFAFGFVLNPGLGAALMVLQSLLILANVYRFKKQPVNNYGFFEDQTPIEPTNLQTASVGTV